ncbi:hypothetical protein F5X97DRAFT_299998 [Nemania serpens]|nr:hypothetical protein F5X97DRAFT_299998 [Nemania serpens]
MWHMIRGECQWSKWLRNIRNSARESVLTHHAGLGGAVRLVAAGPPLCHRHVDSTGAPY